MSLPIIAIIGRPNVGKSRLFNRLVGKRQALVDDQTGVTRDRHYGEGDWRRRPFIVIDTGGLIPGAEDPLDQKVWKQAFQAIDEADFLICVFDGMEGVTPADRELATLLRKTKKKIFYAINKIDSAGHEKVLYDFAELGVEPLVGISAEHGRGISDLLEAFFPLLPEKVLEEKVEQGIRVAVIGRPNVGKSTLVNILAGKERTVVHEEAGTTRDAIDIALTYRGEKYLFVDTAGIKRKKSTLGRLDHFSVMTTLKAMERAEIVVFLIDGFEGLTHQDSHLIHFAWESGKGVLLLVNKWDLVEVEWEEYEDRLLHSLGEVKDIIRFPIVAKEGWQCDGIYSAVQELWQKMHVKISTSDLNRWLESVQDKKSPPLIGQKPLKLYYLTQVGEAPPAFVVFVNQAKGIPEHYRRFLRNEMQNFFSISGIPLHLGFRKRR